MENMISFWQTLPERIDPVFLQLGPIQIRYYGLMYLLSFLVFYALIRYRVKRQEKDFTKEHVDDYLTWAIVGVLVGARLGYALFYNFNYYIAHPIEIFWPVHTSGGETYFGLSGMSYHGGLVGAFLSTIWFCFRRKIKVMEFVDFIIPAVPLGYMFGRIGNFLNGELFGRVTQLSWEMYFTSASSYELRHPSQLYEAFFEGLVLFLILWPLRKKPMASGSMFYLYLIGYGLVRFLIEFVREPDAHIGFVLATLSMGQVLCLVMILFGAACLLKTKKA